MIRGLLKSFVLAASVTVALPYTAAVLCNILYGWPQTKRRYRRALNPCKVYALNYTLLQIVLRNIRYSTLFVQWKYFYSQAGPPDIIKDIKFGRNEKTLDVYIPRTHGQLVDRPVVMFVYGGAWGSGNKNMYGLLCHSLANRLGAIVVCPNYSLYPQGYVDDMIQDLVDCVAWIHDNAENYNGSKDKIMMIGHSAGAHLCAMALTELLLQSEGNAGAGAESRFAFGDSIHFTDTHFDGKNESNNEKPDVDQSQLERSSASSASFCVLSENGEHLSNNGNNSNTASTFEVVSGKDEDYPNMDASGGVMEGFEQIKSETKVVTESVVSEADSDKIVTLKQESEEDISEDDSIVTVKPKEVERHVTLVELVKAIKAVVGLSGVYDISEHFVHESGRGIEDLSSMARAMYAEDHFDRFSPSVVIQTVPASLSFPRIVLIHGMEDYVVPVSSTTKFAEALQEVGCEPTVRIIPGCDHYDICMDLMKPNRKFHYQIMSILLEVSQNVFSMP